MIVGSKYVLPVGDDDDVASLKINQHIYVLKILKVNYEYPDPLFHGRWYVGTKVHNRGGCKNHKCLTQHPSEKYLFSSHIVEV